MQTPSVFPKGALQTENGTEFTVYSRHASQTVSYTHLTLPTRG